MFHLIGFSPISIHQSIIIHSCKDRMTLCVCVCVCVCVRAAASVISSKSSLQFLSFLLSSTKRCIFQAAAASFSIQDQSVCVSVCGWVGCLWFANSCFWLQAKLIKRSPGTLGVMFYLLQTDDD
ncbi:hypothetical protein XENOCAPTIV_021647 [Xenoophorus captivus]|uniref:Uncharacterized protein n=1 Tax=Xenoophorus captivus TaxID=1517983 RepID=A0ABV0R2W0_9TELE